MAAPDHIYALELIKKICLEIGLKTDQIDDASKIDLRTDKKDFLKLTHGIDQIYIRVTPGRSAMMLQARDEEERARLGRAGAFLDLKRLKIYWIYI